MEYELLYHSMNIFCVVILLLIMMKAEVVIGEYAKKHFMIAMGAVIMYIVTDSLWMRVHNMRQDLDLIVIYAVYSLYFVSVTVVGYCMYSFLEYLQDNKKHALQILDNKTVLPIAIHIIMSVINVYTGFMFIIDENHEYIRGSFFMLEYLFVIGYLLMTSVRAFKTAIETDNVREKGYYQMIAFFPIIPLISNIIQAIVHIYPIISMGVTLTVLILFINQVIELISLDPMTRLTNKQEFARILERKIKEVSDKNCMYMLMIDIDKFKNINDTYGHIEGDRAIIRVADALRTACSDTYRRNTVVARFGGDEFMVMVELENSSEQMSEVETAELCNIIKNEIKKANENAGVGYDLRCTIGKTMIQKDDYISVEKIIASADEDLYRLKRYSA